MATSKLTWKVEFSSGSEYKNANDTSVMYTLISETGAGQPANAKVKSVTGYLGVAPGGSGGTSSANNYAVHYIRINNGPSFEPTPVWTHAMLAGSLAKIYLPCHKYFDTTQNKEIETLTSPPIRYPEDSETQTSVQFAFNGTDNSAFSNFYLNVYAYVTCNRANVTPRMTGVYITVEYEEEDISFSITNQYLTANGEYKISGNRSITYEGKKFLFDVVSSHAWAYNIRTISGPSDWISASIIVPSNGYILYSGVAGQLQFEITLNKMPNGEKYESYVDFSIDGAIQKTIHVWIETEYEGTPEAFSLRVVDVYENDVPDAVTFASTDPIDRTYTWTVKTNGIWNCYVNQSPSGWIEVPTTNGMSGSTTFQIKLKQKPTTGTNTAYLWFTGESNTVVKTITVTCEAANQEPEVVPEITYSGTYISYGTMSLPSSASTNDTYSFTVTSNVDWRITCSDTWLSVTQGIGTAGSKTATIKLLSVPDGDTFTASLLFWSDSSLQNSLTVTLTKAEQPHIPGEHFPAIQSGEKRAFFTWTSGENTTSLFNTQTYTLSGTALPEGAIVTKVMAYVYVKVGGSTSTSYTMGLTQLSVSGGPVCVDLPTRSMTGSQEGLDVPTTGYAALIGDANQMKVFAQDTITVNLKGTGGISTGSAPTRIWVRGIYFAVDYIPVRITWTEEPNIAVFSGNKRMVYVTWKPVLAEGGTGNVTYTLKEESGAAHGVVADNLPYYCLFIPEEYNKKKSYTLTASYSGQTSQKILSIAVDGSITAPSDLKITHLDNGNTKVEWKNSEVEWGGGSVAYNLTYTKGTEIIKKENVTSGYLIADKLTEGEWTFELTAIYSENDKIKKTIVISHSASYSNTIKIYDGKEWVTCTVNIFDGTEWVECVPYIWDGTNWVPCSFT